MLVTKKFIDELTYKIIGCAIEVHRILGPGLLESLYEKCFIHELKIRGLNYDSQRLVPLNYKDLEVDGILRYDVLVEGLILVELKTVDGISPIHKAIILSYMEMLKKPKGIIINFNCLNIFKEGQTTLVNKYYASLP